MAVLNHCVFRFFIIFVFLINIQTIYSFECEKLVGNECKELEWQFVHTGAGEVAAISIAKSDPDIVYAGLENNAHALYKSTDGGKSWKRLSGPGDHAKDIAVSPKNAIKAYVAMSESIHSTDKNIKPTSKSKWSASWEGSDTIDILSSNRHPGPSVTSFSTIEIFSGDDKIIYTAVKGGMEIFGFGDTRPEIFKTVNGGNTWQSIRPQLNEINVISIYPSNHEVIYIGAGDGLYKSQNSGKDVQKILKFYDSVISVEISKINPNILVAASSSKIFKSTDGGNNWNDITNLLQNIHRVIIAPSDQNILYAATFNGVFKSIDGGQTWQDKSSNLKAKNIQIVEIHPTNSDIAFIGTSTLWSSSRAENRYMGGLYAGQGIFKTNDGGDSWYKSDEGIFEYNIEDVAVNPNRRSRPIIIF